MTRHKKAAGKERPIRKAITQSDNNTDKTLIEKQFFSENKSHCFECEARLTKSNRKRMLLMWQTVEHKVVSPYQLCKPCAKKLDERKFLSLPKISKDLKEASFRSAGAHAVGVGGIQ